MLVIVQSAKVSILVVAADAARRREIIGRMGNLPVTPAEAGGCDAAVEKVAASAPGIVIISNDLPGGEAMALCRALKGDSAARRTPVIMLVAEGKPEERIAALEAGADDYLFLPLHQKEVKSRLSMLIALKHAQDQLSEKSEDLIRLVQLMKKYLPGNLQKEIFESTKRDLIARNKTMAILYSDIRGFTRISEGYSPAMVIDILNCILYFLFDIILRNHGRIDKVIGDAILATFEADEHVQDPCCAAAMTALEIQREMDAFNDVMKVSPKFNADGKLPDIMLGIGINFAEVIQGNLGTPDKMDYTVIGDGVNMASRCQALAKGGEIIITSAAYEMVRDKFKAEALAPIQVKGKKEPQQLYKVIR